MARRYSFLAAFIEAFWSASRVPPVQVKYAVGIGLWVVTLAYFVFVGRGGNTVSTIDEYEPNVKGERAA
jgi:hypothetical protein